jgi:hypothetical protein
MTFVFKHPKFYRIPRDKEEARAQLKVPSSNSDQVISRRTRDGGVQRAPGPGQSSKQQASSKVGSKASSLKQQASSSKPGQVIDASIKT